MLHKFILFMKETRLAVNCKHKTVIETQMSRGNQSYNLVVFCDQLSSLNKLGRITTLKWYDIPNLHREEEKNVILVKIPLHQHSS